MMLQWRILMEQIDYKFVKKIAEEYGTPYYLMNSDIYEKNVMNFVSALKKYYDRILVGYSFKTNYVPALCKKALALGCYAEVVSAMEFELALKCGFSNIIFNGPIKTYNYLSKAFDLGVVVNLDSEYELQYVLEYQKNHPNKALRVGIRVNINLKDVLGNSVIQNGLKQGRFGFSSDTLSHLVEKLKSSGVIINSIHGHTSSSDRAAKNYETIVQYMSEVCKKYELNDIEYFDIGGGFFGAAADGINVIGKPVYEDYAKTVFDILHNDEWFKKVMPILVIEPGSSVVSNVFGYVSQVYQVKNINGKCFVTTDGCVFEVKPTMHNNNLPFKLYSHSDCKNNVICDFVGSTCMEKDIILSDVTMPEPKFGDFVKIDGVGAYTMVLTPDFINYKSPIIDISCGKNLLVRRRQTLSDIINTYIC